MENIKTSKKKKKKIKTSAPADEFELPDALYSVSDIHDYFHYIIKRQEILADNPPVRIYINKIKDWNKFVIKTRTSGTMKLLESTKNKLLITCKFAIKLMIVFMQRVLFYQ